MFSRDKPCFIFPPPPQSMDELISKTVPENIRLNRLLKLDTPLCEYNYPLPIIIVTMVTLRVSICILSDGPNLTHAIIIMLPEISVIIFLCLWVSFCFVYNDLMVYCSSCN